MSVLTQNMYIFLCIYVLFHSSQQYIVVFSMCCAQLLRRVQLFATMDCSPPGSSIHGNSPGKNTGMCCHSFLQGSSQSRDWAQVSCIAGRFFIVWATREAQIIWADPKSNDKWQEKIQREGEVIWVLLAEPRKEALEPAEAGSSKEDSKPETSKGVWPCQHLDFRLLILETV